MAKKIKLIESESSNPEVTILLRPGTSVEMVEIIPPNENKEAKAGRAALCGYSNACLALIEVGD
ncbi:hypothetical protein [Alteromonas macleodii]|uniref:hypothetical protein n=1 Tax=Alteromonas macleodii TaxID=28108 RepID=UPI000C78ACE2|nr:hypothetical protein [Alteromonas macleodii]AUI83419.1 hypothetical protein TE101_14505 [Alteromonas macleodii]NKW88578.1 hypothetical protein [Alteromonadaceae bacterium A_SAG4]NKX33556.1 hypothetical protein [Alteromonadaceae bacterium A_SAG3]